MQQWYAAVSIPLKWLLLVQVLTVVAVRLDEDELETGGPAAAGIARQQSHHVEEETKHAARKQVSKVKQPNESSQVNATAVNVEIVVTQPCGHPPDFGGNLDKRDMGAEIDAEVLRMAREQEHHTHLMAQGMAEPDPHLPATTFGTKAAVTARAKDLDKQAVVAAARRATHRAALANGSSDAQADHLAHLVAAPLSLSMRDPTWGGVPESESSHMRELEDEKSRYLTAADVDEAEKKELEKEKQAKPGSESNQPVEAAAAAVSAMLQLQTRERRNAGGGVSLPRLRDEPSSATSAAEAVPEVSPNETSAEAGIEQSYLADAVRVLDEENKKVQEHQAQEAEHAARAEAHQKATAHAEAEPHEEYSVVQPRHKLLSEMRHYITTLTKGGKIPTPPKRNYVEPGQADDPAEELQDLVSKLKEDEVPLHGHDNENVTTGKENGMSENETETAAAMHEEQQAKRQAAEVVIHSQIADGLTPEDAVKKVLEDAERMAGHPTVRAHEHEPEPRNESS